MFRISYKKALQKTNHITYQAMEAFIHNLNTMYSKEGAIPPHSSISFGTDTSPEGRMVTQNFLEVLETGIGNGETPIFPACIFKVKEGINYNPEDPNYDLFELACRVCTKRLFPNFSFLDAPFNSKLYQKENYQTEACYMGSTTRILENIVDTNKQISTQRGNLSTTTINLPRLGIKYGKISNETVDLTKFFAELEEKMDLVKDQLLERYEIQTKKKVYHFPFLMGQNLWIDSEKLKQTDNLKKVLKHGNLSIGFIGLAECLKALTGKHHGEEEESQKLGIKIVAFMRKKCDEYAEKYNLNFNLMGTPSEELEEKFIKKDQAIYGKLKGITDKEGYTHSFHIPAEFTISVEDKIRLEAPYHNYTNGGHVTYVTLDSNKLQDVAKTVRIMRKAGIGYGAINPNLEVEPFKLWKAKITNS